MILNADMVSQLEKNFENSDRANVRSSRGVFKYISLVNNFVDFRWMTENIKIVFKNIEF